MRDIMLIVHFISVALLVGTAFSTFILNQIFKREQENKIKLQSLILPLNYISKTGLTLLILSGGYLMTPFWPALGIMPLLIVKLVIAGILLGTVILVSIKAKQAKKYQTQNAFNKVKSLQNINLILGIATVFIAVFIFH
jgi:uncharacterized membrane protein